MANEFMLATQANGVAGLDLLVELTDPVDKVPIASPVSAPEYDGLGDGSYREAGAPAAEWLFPVLTVAEYTQLKAFAGWCYVRTIDDEASYADYLAWLKWPLPPPPIKAGLIFDLVMRFEMMVEQEEVS